MPGSTENSRPKVVIDLGENELPQDVHLTIQERLRRNVLLETLTDAQFASVRKRLREKSYRGGAVILDNEGPGDRLFLLVQGRVRISNSIEPDDDTMLALLHQGDCFGELELIDGRHRSSFVMAVDDCVTYELPKDDVEDLLRTVPAFAMRLLHLLSVRLRAMNYHFIQELEQSDRRAAEEMRKLRQLIEASQNVNSSLNLDNLLTIILDTALNIVQCDRGTLYLVDEAKKELWSKILKGEHLVEIRLPIGKGIAGYVAATGDTLNIPDAYLDQRFDPATDGKTGYRTKTMLCMPMRNRERKIIGVLQLINKKTGLFDSDDEQFINALSIHSSIAIENARLHEQEKQKLAMEKDLRAARDVQMSLLPKQAPVLKGYDIAGRSAPAQLVGGDYFDFIRVNDDEMVLCLGDISGKGLPASLLMANLQATLRGQTIIEGSPKIWLRRSNGLLYETTNSDKFMTLFFAVLDHAKNTLTYTNAGHDHPFLISKNGDVRRLKKGGLVMSIVPDYEFEEETVTLRRGDLLVINSDGVTEALNKKKEQFGEPRFEETVLKNKDKSAKEIIEEVFGAVDKFCKDYPQFDDMTMVVLKVL